MNKFYETLTNQRGDVLFGYRAQVVDSFGTIVDIYRDRSGTRFTDGAGNIVNYATADEDTGMVQFYWTAATGQLLQILDPGGDLARPPIEGFGDNFVLTNLPGEIAQSSVVDLVTDLAAKADTTTVDAALATKVATADLASTDTGKGAALVGLEAGGTVEGAIKHITPEMYGAVGNTLSDDSAAFAAMKIVAKATGFPIHCGKPKYYLASDFEVDWDGAIIRGLGDRGTQFLFAPDAQFRTKPGISHNDYQVKRLILEDLMFYVSDATARSKPTVAITHALYVTARNCTFYGDTPKTQPALLLQSTLYAKFDKCDFWGGAYGVYGGEGTNSPNDITFNSCNFNGSTVAIDGNFFVLNITGGSCQSVGDGFMISNAVNETSSSIVITGVYFEGIAGRCVSAGSNGFVYNITIAGCYYASLDGGMVSPIYLKKVVGFQIGPNHWAGYDVTVTGLVEIDYHRANPSAGVFVHFPRKGSIRDNVNPYTDELAQYFWSANLVDIASGPTIADQKSLIIGATEGFGTGKRKVRTSLMNISEAGTVNATIFDGAKPRYIYTANLICENALDVSADLTVGVGASLGFHVASTPIGVKSAQTFTALTLNNPQTRPANGVVFARIVSTVVTDPGSVVVELEYSEAP